MGHATEQFWLFRGKSSADSLLIKETHARSEAFIPQDRVPGLNADLSLLYKDLESASLHI